MSFILDALRKSENARLRQEHPAMFDARAAATRRRFPAWFLALGLLLGLNLLALLYVLLRDERNAAVMPDGSVPGVASPISAPAPAASTVGAPADAGSAAPTASAAVPSVAPAARRPSAGVGVTPPATTMTQAVAPQSIAAPTAPARTRDDLLAAGDAVPETQVSLHVYDADPGKRFVFLNGQRLREGDVAANGLRVERIDADGVVLDHRGSDFKVRLEP